LKTKYRKASKTGSHKNPKTLSGIETIFTLSATVNLWAVTKTLKPYQGLKPSINSCCDISCELGHKNPKTLSGIETYSHFRRQMGVWLLGHKNPKTLSGIETGNKTARNFHLTSQKP